MNNMNEEEKKMYSGFLKDVPVRMVPDALGVIASDHDGCLYSYTLDKTEEKGTLVINISRNQWLVKETEESGDDALSLALYFKRVLKSDVDVEKYLSLIDKYIAAYISHHRKYIPRVACQTKPIVDKRFVIKDVDKSVGMLPIPGLSAAILQRYCKVLYRVAPKVDENSQDVAYYWEVLEQVDDLHTLNLKEKECILRLFRACFAIPNVNGGYQLYDNHGDKRVSFPEQESGYCIIKDNEKEQSIKLFVFENIVDFLAFKEIRHKNGTEMILPDAEYLIINGEENKKQALAYIHKRCDFLEVICLFPADSEGLTLYKEVQHATNDNCKDASYLYTREHSFSLSENIAGWIDLSLEKAEEELRHKEVVLAAEQYRKQLQESQKGRQEGTNGEESKNKKSQTILIPSAQRTSLLDMVKIVLSKLRRKRK